MYRVVDPMLVDSEFKDASSVSAISTTLADQDDGTAPSAAGPSSVELVHWFKKKAPDGTGAQDQMFQHADEHMHKVFLARDGYQSNKQYASCEKHSEVAEFLLHRHQKGKPCNLYELIRDGKECKAYVDVEWDGPTNEDPSARLDCLLDKLNSSFREAYKIDPEFIVFRGSRIQNYIMKNSYHIIATNIAFSSNLGEIKSFFKNFVEENKQVPLLNWDDNGETTSIIDLSVYSKNRLFRTPLSHKGDDVSRTKLCRIERIEVKRWREKPIAELSIASLLDSLVTYIPCELRANIIMDCVAPLPFLQGSHTSKSRALQTKERQRKSQSAGCIHPEVSEAVARMQAMLRDKGIEGIRVKGIKFVHEAGRTIYECRNDGPRKCISKPDEIHKSNNVYLQHEPDGKVLHKCLAPSCEQFHAKEIGWLAPHQNSIKCSESDDDKMSSTLSVAEGNEMSVNLSAAEVDYVGATLSTSRDSDARAKLAEAEDNHVNNTCSAAEENNTSATLFAAKDDCVDVNLCRTKDKNRGAVLSAAYVGSTLSVAEDYISNCDHNRAIIENMRLGTDVGKDTCLTEFAISDKMIVDSVHQGCTQGNRDSVDGVQGVVSLGKHPVSSSSRGDEKDSNKRLCMDSCHTSEAQTEVSFSNSSCLDLCDIERLVTHQSCTGGRMLNVRKQGFRSAPTSGSEGRDGRGDQTEVISTVHLQETHADIRPYKYRLTVYIKGILMAEGPVHGFPACAQVLADAMSDPKAAKSFLKELYLNKKDKRTKQLRSALKKIEGTSTAIDHAYSLRLLQRWYISGDKEKEKKEMGSYKLVKEQVEKDYVKLTSPYCFVQHVQSEERNEYCLVPEQSVRGNLRNKFSYDWRKAESDDDDSEEFIVVKQPFVVKWLADEEIKTFTHITFDPSKPQGGLSGTLFNTWTGIKADYIQAVSDEDAAQALVRFREHILGVVGNEQICNFILDYFAHIVQKPEKKTGVCILLQGSQGCGKGTIFDTFRNILGHDVSFQCVKAKDQLFGKFSVGLKNRIFVQVDEAKDLSDIDELMKDIATCDRKQFEDKGVQPYRLRVYANIVVTSNEDHPVRIPDRERRWVAIKCCETFTGNVPYFTQLHTVLEQPQTLRGIFQGLKSRDISHISNMQNERPITDYYMECCKIFTCPLSKFLSAMCNSPHHGSSFNTPVQASSLYKDFRAFADRAGLSGDVASRWTVTFFGIKMKAYANEEGSGITQPGNKGKTGGVSKYCFDFDVLRVYLKAKGRFDEDAELPNAGHDYTPP